MHTHMAAMPKRIIILVIQAMSSFLLPQVACYSSGCVARVENSKMRHQLQPKKAKVRL